MSEVDFLFCEKPPQQEGAVIDIPTGLGQKKLLIDAYRSAGFPGYLANNWDSLFDCLRDFSWIEKRVIQILHHDLPMSDDVEGQRVYLSLLADAVGDWQGDEAHRLEVVFPLRCKATVQHLLRFR